jgi:glycosyltransferase involved in cell wall biosynthesis
MSNPYLSVAIPCYEMYGKGDSILEVSFNKLIQQTYKDFEVVITDHSKDNRIMELCQKWDKILDIRYFRNPYKIGSPTANTNMSIRKSKGQIIKLLCQDDYLYDEHSLDIIVKSFTSDCCWLATSYVHTNDRVVYFNKHVPRLSNDIRVNNLIGTPSTITVRNGAYLLFDESLVWLYDVDFYYRMIRKYGVPKIIDQITMINYLWEGQVTNTLANIELRQIENEYVMRKVENVGIE